ncbi:hypothetical protein BCV69DRAFT_301850 [Microstroma glucosiphilum]|uniref:Uncharacterized protein n=1 Tax=Pseudomicrostroma glucosiphilum TaxID=1684307 RepID=A0A316TWH8_9BASI|nr:hypothetical protein BCV69DRAFT_301850 [Pseudomicrostroma glucosiphilum]PWN17836.1 hypothetical protein BCV69DRAFT_301850 [Pseudomicrostroma glucosiphilum]
MNSLFTVAPVTPKFDHFEPKLPPAGPESKEDDLSFAIRGASMCSQLRAAWGVYLPQGSGSIAEIAVSMSLVFSGIWHSEFEAADQSVRQLVATNVTLFLLTTGIEVERLLANMPTDYLRRGLVWGDLLFVLWGDKAYRIGKYGPKLTLTARVPSNDGAAPKLLTFASLHHTSLDRDTARLMFLLALKVNALPESAMDFVHRYKTASLLASDAAQVDAHGRRYVVFKAQASMAKEPVFAFHTASDTASAAGSSEKPLIVPTKQAYTLAQYELDLRTAMLRKWPFAYSSQELRQIWDMGATKFQPGFESFPLNDSDVQEMMDHTNLLLRKGSEGKN